MALALAPLLWSGNFVVGKVLIEAFPPFTLSALRWTIGALVLAPLVAFRPLELRKVRPWLPGIAALAVTGVLLYSALVYAALRDTTAVNATLIQAAIPMVTVLMAVLLLGEPLIWRHWIGIAVAFAGVTWIVSRGDTGALAALRINPGDLLMVGNVVIWAVYTIIAQRVLRQVDTLVATFLSIVIGLVMLLPVAAWEMGGRAWPAPTPPLVAGVAYLGVFPSIVAYVLWNSGVAAVGAARAALFVNLLPVYTAVLAGIFLDEVLALHHVVGGALVAGGVFVGTRPREQQRDEPGAARIDEAQTTEER